MTGIDPRIKAAACLYGSGNLQMGNMWWDAYGRSDRFAPILREHWRTTLDPAFRLPHCKTPIAWFTGTNDWFFWMPSVMRTFEMAGGPKSLTLLPGWDHAVSGEISEQPFAWLDAHLKGKPGFLEVSALRVEQREGALWAFWDYNGPRRAKTADVIVSWGEAGNWHARCWKTLRADFKKGICQVRLPAADGPFFLSGSVTDTLGFRYSTPLKRVNPARFVSPGAAISVTSAQKSRLGVFDTDGCAEWGNFEWADCIYLRRHRWWAPHRINDALSSDAFSGRKAMTFGGGSTRLPLFHFSAGYVHQLRFWAKSKAPTVVGVRWNAGFCGKARDVLQWRRVGTNWTLISVDVMPHEDLSFRYNASLVVPPDVEILADEFSFCPVEITGQTTGQIG